MRNESNNDDESQPMMILTIDVGNGHYDKLQLFDLNNIEQETYDFCVKNKLDFNTMQEIINQIENVIKDKQIQEEREKQNSFQEIKEEEENDEKMTDDNIINENDKQNQQESFIMTNNLEINSEEKQTKNTKNNDSNLLNNEKSNTKNENKIKNDNNQIKNSNNNNNVNENKQNKKDYKFKKKNIKDNLKEAFSFVKEQTKEKSNAITEETLDKENYPNKQEQLENNNEDININNDKYIDKNNKDNDNNKENLNKEIDISNIIIEKQNQKELNNNNNKSNSNKNERIINKIFNENDNDNNNIYKETKQSKKMAKTMSSTVSYFNGYNPGIELYKRGLKFMENEKEKLEMLKKNLEIDDLEENTFFPKTNKMSQLQNDRRREKQLECSNPEIIKNYKQYKEFKLKCLKQKTDEEFNKIHTFKPCINRSSSNSKILRNNNNINSNNNNNNNNNNNVQEENKTTFDRLYNYSLNYKENNNKLKEKIYNEYSFKPQINEKSTYFRMNVPFHERLQTYSNKSKENKIKIQKIHEKELGYNESFKPHLNSHKNKILLKDRDPIFTKEAQTNDNNNYIDPYTKLYLYGKKYEQEKNEMAEKYYQSQNTNPKFCDVTQEIINNKKEKSFKKIFKLLDGDDDNKISANNICTSNLPKNILKILEPFFEELREENETLNELEFIFVCEQLFLSLPWNEQRELASFEDYEKKNIKKEKILKEKNDFSFKPNINKKRYFSFEKSAKLKEKNNINKNKNVSNINHNNNLNDNKNKNNSKNDKRKNDSKQRKNYNSNNIPNIPKQNNNYNDNDSNHNIEEKNSQKNNKNNSNIKRNYSNYSISNNLEIIINKKDANNYVKNKKGKKKINYDNFINVK